MKPMRTALLLRESMAALFVLLFVYTGLMKLRDVNGFLSALQHSPAIGPFASLLAWAIPFGELAIVVLLCLPKTRSAGMIAATMMMLVFTVYIVYMLWTSSLLPCTCGGVVASLSWEEHLLFNSFFLLGGFLSLVIQNKKYFYHDNRSRRIPV